MNLPHLSSAAFIMPSAIRSFTDIVGCITSNFTATSARHVLVTLLSRIMGVLPISVVMSARIKDVSFLFVPDTRSDVARSIEQ